MGTVMIPRGSPHNRNAPSMPALPVNRGQGCARAGIIPPAPDEAVAQVAEATACRREFPASRCVVACCPIYPPWSSTHKFSTCFFRAISGGNGRALGTEQATVGWTWARAGHTLQGQASPHSTRLAGSCTCVWDWEVPSCRNVGRTEITRVLGSTSH